MFEEVQNTIGYQFNNEDLIQQAFVRRSFSEENGGQNNEVLEFIGDKALDLAVIRIMMERFGVITEDKSCHKIKLKNPKYFQTKLKEGKFTDIKKDLVEKKALARSMEELGFHNELIMGSGDIKNNIQDKASVKEDLFEAIIGAVALDCEWDMDIITNVVRTMIDFDDYFEGYDNGDSSTNYVGLLQEWMQRQDGSLPDYSYDELYNGFRCNLYIPEIGRFYADDISTSKARMAVAEEAYDYLVDNGYILNDFEEAIGEPILEDALKQINELHQKGLISKPEYTFSQEYDEYGRAVWTCECTCDESDSIFDESSLNKREAQRYAAYYLLCDLTGYEPEED